MDKHHSPAEDSSNAQASDAQDPPQQRALHSIFNARLVADWENGEVDFVYRNFHLQLDVNKLLTEVEETCAKNHARLASEIRLRDKIDTKVKAARWIHEFSLTFFRAIGQTALDFLSGRDAFRNFTGSRAFRRTCEDLLDDQIAAKEALQMCKNALHFKLSDELLSIDDFMPVAAYIAAVSVHFYTEFNRYARDVVTPQPTDDEIYKLRGLVGCMSFDSDRSIGRLVAHGQHVRQQLGICESLFLDVWVHSSPAEAHQVSRELALLRGAMHIYRRNIMLIVSIAMKFVHDEDDDRFIAFCRHQEDMISSHDDSLCAASHRIQQLMDKLKRFRATTDVENHRWSVAADPVERSIQYIHPRLVPIGYDVFLAHDSTENSVRLASYLQFEIQRNQFSCYMEYGDLGTNVRVMLEATERALDDTCVAVFLLTPELAKEKLKVAQIRHMLNRVREARMGWPGPTLIPIFYKLGVRECRDGNIFGETEEDADAQDAKRAFDEITRYTGIENLEGVTDEDSKEMKGRREGLVARATDAVVEACLTIGKECCEQLPLVRNEEARKENEEAIGATRQQITDFRQRQREGRERAFFF